MWWVRYQLRRLESWAFNDPAPCLQGGEHDWCEEVEIFHPGLDLMAPVVFCSKCLQDP